jgi:glutathione S-transferase
MAELELVIGNKNLSSWSLRPWLLMAHAGIPFREQLVPLYPLERRARLRDYSPNGKVPALRHGDLLVWESLAIAEYVADLYPDRQLWPADRTVRAVARAVSTEMHAGFGAMRETMTMNIVARTPLREVPAQVSADIARVIELWKFCRSGYGASGPFLFGAFSIADAMFAPVVTRFVTYGVEVDGDTRAYMETILGLPAMQRWTADAAAEVAAG